MKWLNSHQVLLWVIITVASSVAYVYTTFATTTYVNQYVDVRHEAVRASLEEIKQNGKETKEQIEKLREEIRAMR